LKQEPSYKILIFLLAAWLIIFMILIMSFQLDF